MSHKEKLQEMLDRYKRYYVYHDFSAQFTEGDIDWLLGQAGILQTLKDNIIRTIKFLEEENTMHDDDYVREVYHAYKEILKQIEQLEG